MLFSSLSPKKKAVLGTSFGVLLIIGVTCAIWQRVTQTTSASLSPMQRAYDRLVSESEERPQVQMHNGIARFVAADVETRGNTPAERAENYVATYAALYGMSPSSDTQVEVQRVRAVGEEETSVVFAQTYKGIPVFGGQLLVAFRGDRIYSTIGSLFVPERPLSIDPVLTQAEALERAREAMGAKHVTTYAETHLEVYDPAVSDAAIATSSQPHLAWRVFIATPEQKEVHLDAMDGTILSVFGTVQEHGGLDDYELDLEDANGAEATAENLCYRLTSDDDWIGDEDGLIRSYHGDRDAVRAWWDFRNVYEFFHNSFALHSYDNDGEDIEVYVHAGGAVVRAAASYNPNCDIFQFSNGNNAFDITVHEFTHAVIEQSSQLVYQNQSGALNESFADIMAAVAEGNWLIGEARTGGGNAFRDLSDPPRFNDPDTMPPRMITTDNGGVHTNSGIQNKVASLIAEGGVHNGVQVQAIGRPKLGQLMFNVMRTIPSSAQLIDARNRAVVVAESWAHAQIHGFTRQDACSVRNAYFAAQYRGWDDRTHQDTDCDGVEDERDPDADGDSIPDAQDNCPNARNIDQRDTDRDGVGDACDTDADNDGVNDSVDNCPNVPNPRQEMDRRTGRPYACQDSDSDGVLNGFDNCPEHANADQRDMDHDGVGDVCDTDMDHDGIDNDADNCPTRANRDQQDTDGDGRGDACDNCPLMSSTNFADRDRDGIGDVCDPDRDGDGIPNDEDLCPDSQICPSSVADEIGSILLPSTPQPSPFRVNLSTLLCPTCGVTIPSPTAPTCYGLVLEGASPRDRFWLTNTDGRSAGRFLVTGEAQSMRLTEGLDESYSLNIIPTARPRSASSTVVHFRLDSTVCTTAPIDPLTPRATTTRPLSPTIETPMFPEPTSTIISTVPPEKVVLKEELDKVASQQEPEKVDAVVTPKKPEASVPEKSETPLPTKEDPVPEKSAPTQPPVEEKQQESTPEPVPKPDPKPAPAPDEPELKAPVFSSKPPMLVDVTVSPSMEIFYGQCLQQPTRLRFEFTAQSVNQLTTIAVTYQTLRQDGSSADVWKNAQLFSLGGDRYMAEIDAQAFAMKDLDGVNGALRYQILLIDEANLQATVQGRREISVCTTTKK